MIKIVVYNMHTCNSVVSQVFNESYFASYTIYGRYA